MNIMKYQVPSLDMTGSPQDQQSRHISKVLKMLD